MATEIVAAPISTMAVPQGMAINPIFDWNVALGVPLWLFVTCFFFFVFVAVIVYWMARIHKLSAIRGWKESLQNMSVNDVQVWIISRTQKLVIECMTIEDNILSYHDKSKIGMWHHNTRESVIRVGGNPAVVVSEDFDQTRDLISEIALTDNCDTFNENQEDLEKFLKEKYETDVAAGKEVDEPEVVRPIENYTDYENHGRKTLQLVNPDGLPMATYNIFSNIRFLKYFPLGCSHMFFGGELLQDAKFIKTKPKDKGFLEKHAFLILAITVGAILVLASWFCPLGR